MRHLIVFLLIVPSLACARLGETEEQLVARFGAAATRAKESTFAQGKIVEFGTKLTFRQGDWSIECAITDGRSSREVYHKQGEWTEDQFATVLNSNSQGGRWTDSSKAMVKKVAREWRRDDGATAVWQMGTGMVVTQPAYLRAKEKAEAKAKADARRVPKI